MSETNDSELLRQAWDVLENSYSPYSKMRVGAVLRARDGQVFAGCNVENASFGLTVCAERSAISAAVGLGVREFESIAIVSDGKAPLMPCGACRQVLLEFAPELRVLVESRDGERVETTLQALLPSSFRPGDLSPREDS
jgi:cytidine deaminase